MNALGIFLVCALVVVGNNLVAGAHLYPVPSLIQRDLEDDFALRSYEALLELARGIQFLKNPASTYVWSEINLGVLYTLVRCYSLP